MWPFPPKQDPFEAFIDALPPTTGERSKLSDAQLRFILRALAQNPTARPKERNKMLAQVARLRSRGHHELADKMLDSTLAWGGRHRERVVGDPQYWSEYQEIFYGRRLNLLAYITGRIVPA